MVESPKYSFNRIPHGAYNQETNITSSMPAQEKSPRLGFVLNNFPFFFTFVLMKNEFNRWFFHWKSTEKLWPKYHHQPKIVVTLSHTMFVMHHRLREIQIHFKWCDIRKSFSNAVRAQTRDAIPIMVKWKMSFNHQYHHQFNDSIHMRAAAHRAVLLPIFNPKV